MPIVNGLTERRDMMAAMSVVIADDHPLMVAGVRRVLERDDQISVVGEAHSATELVAMVDRRRPDVVVMDLRMPGMPGNICIQRLRAAWPELTIIVLSASDEPAVIDAALASGASSFVVKSVEAGDLAALIRQVASGEVYHATPRPSTAAISQDLWVSEHTVKFHLTNIYRKLGVPNRAAAIRYALDHQLTAA
jgi:DNA-binding NarL/FixJ family response regulator